MVSRQNPSREPECPASYLHGDLKINLGIGTPGTRDTRLTVRRGLYCDKSIKVVFYQDTQSFRASFNGILEVGNPSGEVMICSIRVRERKIRGGVEGLRGD